MLHQLTPKFLSSLLSVLQIIFVVLILYVVQLTTNHFIDGFLNASLFLAFFICSTCLVIEMTLFSFGSETAIELKGKY